MDPYDEVVSDVRAALEAASSMHEGLLRQKRTGRSAEELDWSRDELQAALEGLDGDVEELESTIRVVESGGPRMFGIVRNDVCCLWAEPSRMITSWIGGRRSCGACAIRSLCVKTSGRADRAAHALGSEARSALVLALQRRA